MFKVAVIGSKGMLGKEVVKCLPDDELYLPGHIFNIGEVSVELRDCDFIINCAGAIPQQNSDMTCMIHDNALLPHMLANMGKPMIHVSTDCVFSGSLPEPARYIASDIPNPVDAYGMTKALGEVTNSKVMNLRTSFIGYDHGLLEWLLQQRLKDTINGWTNARWSGSSARAVAKAIVSLIGDDFRAGTYNLATKQSITKYDLLRHLVNRLGLRVHVVPQDYPIINRALAPDFELPFIAEAEL